MGCDIHSYVERKNDDGIWEHEPWVATVEYEDGPFDSRNYNVFGFLADVRNYSGVTPIVEPRGFPDDASPEVRTGWKIWSEDGHTCSYLTADELLAFDYSAQLEDRRVTRGHDGGVTADPGEGKMITYREFLGPQFFQHLEVLRALNEKQSARVIFWFDN
jgi:hypothetical protein